MIPVKSAVITGANKGIGHEVARRLATDGFKVWLGARDAVRVNAAAPGYTATDLNRHQGRRTVQQAAEIIVRLAKLEADGPTGGFFDDNGRVPW